MYLKMILRIVAVHAVNVKQITSCLFTVEEGCDTNFTRTFSIGTVTCEHTVGWTQRSG